MPDLGSHGLGERLWLSPHCLQPDPAAEPGLFGPEEDAP